ncbi:cytochrome d ubiquinol oxidase subunit II [Streptomyces sp. WAC06614]|uniref:cytochrome d ubiquinol oxidase subunit II n=1 Tax=Streptomyces sp. WAC06614 TaxID=2487416 RepID=UPI000F7922D0|nr:cytochrome d ubiquinol oxidase subunit II [Streptomyces sp. WAC06614]RSS68522.1 cytochrome d ubiquinol oxidase subunit II [Streptomyces sp. WAC06614]
MAGSLVAFVLLLAVAAYTCAGGTDYGAGFWDLTAGGAERGRRPRRLIDHAMGPVWEVNNVWLVFVLVLMWTGFPVLFQTVFTALWLPLAVAALGMVLRGAGFALRKPVRRLSRRRLYGAAFAIASLLTPFCLGAAVGAIAAGRVAPGTESAAHAWAHPASLAFGLLTVAATALLGAVFLTADAARFEAPDLVGYFRARALLAWAAVAVTAVGVLLVTRAEAPHVWHGLTHGAGLVLAAGSVAAFAVTGLLVLRGRARWARAGAVAAVGAAVLAWGLAQRPYLIPTSLTVADAAGDPQTLAWLLVVSLVALVLIGPAVALLYWLDTHGELEPLTDSDLGGRTARGDGADAD